MKRFEKKINYVKNLEMSPNSGANNKKIKKEAEINNHVAFLSAFLFFFPRIEDKDIERATFNFTSFTFYD